MNANLAAWRAYMDNPSSDGLLPLLADDAEFHSPIVHTPQIGKKLVFTYLNAADTVFADANFKYVDEISAGDGSKAMLEFTAEIDGIKINGIDIIDWNQDGKIIKFKVLIRPLQGMNKIWEKMSKILEKVEGFKSA